MSHNDSTYDIIALLVSVFLPPLGVLMKRGLSSDFWINIILTILGWFPGIFHAFLIIYLHRNKSNETGEGRPTHGGSRPQKIKVTDLNKPDQPNNQPQYHQQDHQSQNHQSQYQSPKRQQQYTPPSTPPYSHKDPFNDDNYTEPSNEVPPAYGDHKNNELGRESNSYYSDKKSHNFKS